MTLLADPLPHLVAVARAGGESGQPHALFAALDTAMGAVIGHKLFTVPIYHPDAAQSDRHYSNPPPATSSCDGARETNDLDTDKALPDSRARASSEARAPLPTRDSGPDHGPQEALHGSTSTAQMVASRRAPAPRPGRRLGGLREWRLHWNRRSAAACHDLRDRRGR